MLFRTVAVGTVLEYIFQHKRTAYFVFRRKVDDKVGSWYLPSNQTWGLFKWDISLLTLEVLQQASCQERNRNKLGAHDENAESELLMLLC
jgi:hypothetical protein